MPLQPILTSDAIRRSIRAPTPRIRFRAAANYFVGQIVGNMNKSIPAARVMFDMVDEFIDTPPSRSPNFSSLNSSDGTRTRGSTTNG
ncbi:MAG: hypothetical protein R2706_03170 [Acidimicrobiales bacterium]